MDVINMKEKNGVFVADDEQTEEQDSPKVDVSQMKQGMKQFKQLHRGQQILVGMNLAVGFADQLVNQYNAINRVIKKIK